MPAITTMLEAALGPSTELTHAHELARSSGHCRTDEPRWWMVDIGVRAQVVDTSAGAVSRPGAAAFKSREFGSRAPLHISLEVALSDRRSGSIREWLLDATSLRACVFASTINVRVAGPSSLHDYCDPGKSQIGKQVVFAQISAGLWPLDTEHQRVGAPMPNVRSNNCTIRVFVPAGESSVAVPIPTGARSLAIFDASGSSLPWAWQLGESAAGRSGLIVVANGQSLETALVPNFTHVAPAVRGDRDREVLLVFGVDL